MAKDNDIDMDDGLDDFDFGFDDDFDTAPVLDDRKPIVKAATSFLAGAADELSNPGTLKKIALEALPDGYGKADKLVDEISATGRDLYNTTISELKPVIRDAKRVARRALPAVKSFLPEKLAKKLEDMAAPTEQGPTVEQTRETMMQSELSGIFKLQMENDAQDKEENLIVDNSDRIKAAKRFKTEIGALNAIREGVNRQVAYQDQIAAKYQRKSLELQYLQYYTLRDTFEVHRASSKETKTQLDIIAKNTGLPEYRKTQLTEAGGQMFRERILNATSAKAKDYAVKYLGKYKDNITKSFKENVGAFKEGAMGALSGADMLMDSQEMMADTGQGGGDLYSGGGRLAGGMAGGWLGGKIGALAKPFLDRAPGIKKLGNKLEYGVDNFAAEMSDFAKGDKGENTQSGLWNKGLRWLKDMSPQDVADSKLGDSDLLRSQDAVPYNHLAQKSLTEIIPGYLSRIHHELMIMRTGDPDIERMDYDLKDGSFAGLNKISKSLAGSLFNKEENFERGHATTNELIDKLEANSGKKLTPEAREALFNKFIEQAGKSTGSFKVSKLADVDNWDESLSDEDRLSLSYMFSDDVGEEKQNHFSKEFLKIRDYLNNPTDAIKGMAGSGQLEHLRRLGLISGEGDEREVNQDRITQILQQGKIDEVDKGAFDTRLSQRGFGGGPIGGNPNPPRPNPGADPQRDSVSAQDKAVVAAQMQLGDAEVERLAEAIRSGNKGFLDDFIAASSKNPQLDEQTQWLVEIYSLMESGSLVTQSMPFGGGSIKNGINSLKSRLKGLGTKLKGFKLPGFKLPAMPKFGLDILTSPKKLFGAAMAVPGLLKTGAMKLLGKGKDKYKSIKELYINGELFPKMTEAKLNAKEYFNGLTGLPITKWEEVVGPVKNAAGKWVITAEDWAKGLRDDRGKAFLDKTKGKILDKYNQIKAKLTSPFKAVAGLFSKVKKGIMSVVNRPRDIYIPGNPDPVMLASVMMAGGYKNSDGSTISKWTDIKGTVYDLEGLVVVSLETLRKGMVDSAGKKFKSLKSKLFGMIGKGIGKAVKLADNVVQGTVKKVKSGFKALKGGIKGLVGGIKRGMGGGSGSNEMMETIGEYQILLLEEIRDGVRALKPKKIKGDSDGDGDRDGGFADLRAKRQARRDAKAAEKKDAKDPEKKEKKSGLMGLLSAGFGLLAGIPAAISTLTSALLMKKGIGAAADIASSALGGGARRAGRFGRLGRVAGSLGRGAMMLGRGALMAAPLLGSGLAAAGSGIMAAGGAVLSVLGAPVILGIAAVAAVGFGAWWLYKKYKKANKSPLMRLRVAQYGFDPKDEDSVNKMLAFEDLLKPTTSIQGGEAKIDLRKVDIKKLHELFEIDPKDPESVERWAEWYDTRFKPVYANHYAMADQFAEGNLNDVDGALKTEDRLKYLNGVRFDGGDDVYERLSSPFKDQSLSQDANKVNAIFDELAALFKGEDKDAQVSEIPGVTPVALAAGALGAGPKSKMAKFTSFLGDAASKITGLLKYTPLGMMANAASKLMGLGAQAFSWIKNKLFGQEFKVPSILKGEIDPLTSIRYRLYGLSAMEYVRASPISKLEEMIIKGISYTGNKKAEWDGEAEGVYAELGSQFFTNVESEANKKQWMTWFTQRFLPVFINYLTAVRGFITSNPFEAYETLRAPQNLEIARFMNAAVVDSEAKSENLMSVWGVTASPFDDYPMNTIAISIQPFLLAIEADARQEILREKIQVDSSNKAMGIKPPSTKAPSMMAPKSTGTSNSGYSPLQAAMNAATPMAKGTGYTGGGMAILNMASTGGSVNDLPNPSGPDGQWSTYKDLIMAASEMAGVDPGLMGTMAGVESGFRARVKASTSTATGLYQFTGKTWAEMLTRYGGKYGLAANADRLDPRANALMGAEYLKENMTHLEKSLGRKPTDIDLYLGHFLGATGASNFLKADPQSNAAAAMPSAASSNKSIFFDQNRPRSFAQVYAEIDKRMNAFRGTAGSEARAAAGQSEMAVASPYKPVFAGPVGVMAPSAAPAANDPGAGSTITSTSSESSSSTNTHIGPGNTSTPMDQKRKAAYAKMSPRRGKGVRVTLQREESTDSGTYGVLTLPDGSSFQTLELAWRENQTGKSCIPPGTYKTETRNSPKFGGGIYEVKGVPSRSAILIHAGNTAGNTDKGQKSDVQGCILLGMKRGVINGQMAVQESKAALAAFSQKMGGQPFVLSVIGANGAVATANDIQTPASTTSTPSPIAQSIGVVPGAAAASPMSPMSTSFQPRDLMRAPVKDLATSEATLIQKQQLEKRANSIQEQNEEVARVSASSMSGVEDLLARQLEIQMSMDETLRSIDTGIKTLTGVPTDKDAKSKPAEKPKSVRGPRPAEVKVRATPISLRRQAADF